MRNQVAHGRFNLHSLIYVLMCGIAPGASHAEAARDRYTAPTSGPNFTWHAPAPALVASQTAAAVAPDHPLTLAALTDLALLYNPATREAWATARAQAAAVGVAASERFPSIDALVSLTRSTASSTSTQTRLAPSVSLSYVLFDFNARGAAEEAARYGVLAANLTQNRGLQDLVLRVEQAYFQYLGADQTAVACKKP